jgi:hypothetical protein
MQVAEQLDIERLRKQSEFLIRIYRAEIAQDPASRAILDGKKSEALKVEALKVEAIRTNGESTVPGGRFLP